MCLQISTGQQGKGVVSQRIDTENFQVIWRMRP